MNVTNWVKYLLLGIGLGSVAVLVLNGLPQACRNSSRKPELSAPVAAHFAPSTSLSPQQQPPLTKTAAARETNFPSNMDGLPESYVQLCQGFHEVESWEDPSGPIDGCAENACDAGNPGQPSKYMRGIDQNTPHLCKEPKWRNGGDVPWEQFAYGEYIGPFRTPHVDDYRIRIGDQLEFNYLQTRQRLPQKYQLKIGDLIQISSAVDPSLTQPPSIGNGIDGLQIMPDGSVSLALIGEIQASGKTVEDLQRELNDRYLEFVKKPSIIVQVTKSDTPVADLLEAVDSRFGQGGRSRQVTVSPDGTVQLPMIGSTPAIGLTLAEIGREINARYNERIQGVEITPILIQRAPRFIYVVGEVRTAGRYELNAPTTAMQAIALAGGFERRAGNVRQIIVFRRDQNWQLVATKLDLSGAFYGRSPRPSDEIWLRDSDIVLIPPKPIQRLSDAVNLYLTNTIYAVFPQQVVAFNFDNFQTL
jgi:polysaccharide export outer membrane protein